MYKISRKKMTWVNIPNSGETPEEIVKLFKEKIQEEEIISDWLFIEDETNQIVHKERLDITLPPKIEPKEK